MIALTCLGGYLSAGGAGAVNHYYDRDIDAQMHRTASRPIPVGRVSPRAALVFGFVLCALSFLVLSLTVNLLAALLALGGFVGYVGVYTIWLKRRTAQNIVIGGAAGAVPPLVGWAATRGSLSWTAVYLFAIVFYWTPPHFWSLSLLMKDEYAKRGGADDARGPRRARDAPADPALHAAAVRDLAAAVLRRRVRGGVPDRARSSLGLAFIAGAVLLYRRADRRSALRLYLFSLAYLALLFGAMVADVKL